MHISVHCNFEYVSRPVESHSGDQGNILAGPAKRRKHFHAASLERKFWNFSFQNGTFGHTLFIFLAGGGAPNVAGPGVANPLPHPLDEPEV